MKLKFASLLFAALAVLVLAIGCDAGESAEQTETGEFSQTGSDSAPESDGMSEQTTAEKKEDIIVLPFVPAD